MAYRRSSYNGDPRWIKARFESGCDGCPATIAKGADAFYYPSTKSIYGDSCGCADTHAADFEAARQDEDFMCGQF